MQHDSIDIEDLSLDEIEMVAAAELSNAEQWEIAAVIGVVVIGVVAT